MAFFSSLCWPLTLSTLHRQASLLSVRRRSHHSNPSRSLPTQLIVTQIRQLIGLVKVRLFILVYNWTGHQSFVLHLTTENCVANSDFIPVASGGDGNSVQLCKCYSLNFTNDLEWILCHLCWRVCWILAITSNGRRRSSRNRSFSHVGLVLFNFNNKVWICV